MQVLMENVGKMLILKLLLGLKPLLDKTGGLTIQFPKTLQKIHHFSFVSYDIHFTNQASFTYLQKCVNKLQVLVL